MSSLFGAWTLAAGLQIVSLSPGAMCPTEEATREAIDSRMGVLAEGDYLLSYQLFRQGRSTKLQVVLRDQDKQVLLDRVLPMDLGRCEEAALAIAIMLERHFTSLGAPGGSAPAAPPEPDPSLQEARATAPDTARGERESLPAPNSDELPSTSPRSVNGSVSEPKAETEGAVEAAAEPQTQVRATRVWTARAHLSLDQDLSPGLGLGIGARGLSSFRSVFDLRVPLLPRRESIDGASVDLRSALASLSFEYLWQSGAMEISIGPAFSAAYEAASASSVSNPRFADRWVMGLGGRVSVSLPLTGTHSLELGTVLGAQFDGAASRFQLETPSGRLREVLLPRPFTASLGLAWGYSL